MARRGTPTINPDTIASRYKGGRAEAYARFRIALDRMQRGQKQGRIMDPNFKSKRLGNVSG